MCRCLMTSFLIFSGAKESTVASHSHSEMIMTIMDEVRRQLGVVYPAD